MIKKISFPLEEIEQLKAQDCLITTRVSREYNRYHVGEIVTPPWKQLYIVTHVQKIKHIKEHPYYSELTNNQIQLISKYKRIDVLTLKRYSQ